MARPGGGSAVAARLPSLLGEGWGDSSPAAPARGARLFDLVMVVLTGALLAGLLHFILATVGLSEVGKAFGMGLHALARELVLLLAASLIWRPSRLHALAERRFHL